MLFQLDPRLDSDCIFLGDFDLSRLLLMNDVTYPWFILVPRRQQVEEIYQLSDADQQQLWQESNLLSCWMSKSFQYDKLNVAALGNIVRQLHLHHVGRRIGDPTWPGPVWGQHAPQPYSAAASDEIKRQVRNDLAAHIGDKS